MARGKRVTAGGLVYHVLNRGNGKATVFHKPGDFQAFEKLMVEAKARLPVRVLGYCLMSNHWHLVLWQEKGQEKGVRSHCGHARQAIRRSRQVCS